MVSNLLLECVIVTENGMIKIFFKFKWTSWHCHVKTKTNWCMCCDQKTRAANVQSGKDWPI